MGGPVIIDDIPYKELDNFFPCKFMFEGKAWNCSEQLYQALKFKDPDYQEEIRQCTTALEAWAAGQSRDHHLIDDYDECKVELMYIANREKIVQNEEIKVLLVHSVGHISLINSSVFWNRVNGEILERIRRELLDAMLSDVKV